MSQTPLVELRGIHKIFPGVHALKGVNLTMYPGEVQSLVGENGAGKSTLIKIISGVHDPTEGEYLIEGVPADVKSPPDAIAKGISVIYQELNLVPCLSVSENVFFVKMYEEPEVVHAASRRVVDFLVETNRRCLKDTAPYLSAGFFGNDLGSQISPLIGLGSFDEFILPYLRDLIAPIKELGLPVCFHSCGSVEPMIPRLIDVGVDILHPLQALANGMDAETLSKKYKGKLTFMGGIDTQHLLPFGTVQEVKDEVHRLRDLVGDRYIVSPSHEALLELVPFANVEAMSQAAKD